MCDQQPGGNSNASDAPEHRGPSPAAMLDALPDAVVVVDRGLRIVEVNAAVRQVFGVDGPLIGHPCYKTLRGSETICQGCPSLQALQSGEPQTERWQQDVRHGARRWLEVRAVPVSNNGGELTHVVQRVRDVSSEVEATETLRAQRDTFRTFFDMSPDAVLLTRPNGRIHDCNASACRMLGHARHELLDRNIGEFAPDGMATAWSRIADPDQTTGGTLVESRARRRSGDVFPVEVSSRPVTVAGRLFVVIDIRDLSDRKAAIEKLRTSEAELSALMDNMPDSIYFKDTSLRFMRINRALAADLGLDSPQDAVGKSDADFFTESHAKRAAEQERRILETGQPLVDFLERDEFLDGRTRWVSTTQVTLYGDDGHPLGLVGISRDVTRRRRAEEAYRNLVEHSLQGLVILQADEVVFVNDRMAEFSGYVRDELLAMSAEQIWDLVHPDDRDTLWETYLAVRQGREPPGLYTFRAFHRDGSIRHLEAHASAIEYEGLPAVQATVLDVTRRAQAEVELRQSEERLRMIVDSAEDLVVLHDTDGRYVYYNGPKRYGVRAEDLIGKTPVDVLGDQAMSIVDQIKRVAATGKSMTVENRLRWRGETLWFSDLTYPVRDEQGTITHVGKICRNITERRRIEQATRRIEQRMELAVQGAQLGMWEMDLQNQEMSYDDRLAEILNLNPDELGTGLEAWQERVHPDDLGEIASRWQEYIQGKATSFEVEYRVRTAQDHWKWLQVRGRAYEWDERGNVVRVAGTYRDVSERKRAEQALRTSEQRYRSLVENVDLTIILMDRDYNIVMTNPAHDRMFGRSRSDVVGRKCYEAYKGRSEPCPDCGGRRAMATGEPFDREAQSTRPDGEPFAIRVRSYPVIDDVGQPQGFIEIVEDVTAHKQAEEERRRMETRLRESQKLESLGLLAGGVAHDFNNLLTGILGNASLVLMDMPPESPYREAVGLIETSALRAAELTNQMLAYSGRGTFMVEQLDLSELIEGMRSLLESARPKRVRLALRLQNDLPVIRADAGQLHQLMTNLVTNAAEAIGDELGAITIRTGRIDVTSDYLSATYLPDDLPEGDYAFVEVSDTGCGMDADTRARIFDPFFSTKFTGRGLGMAAVLGIVRGHRGAIKVYSEPGKGTTVKILLPSCEQEPEPEDTTMDAEVTSDWRGNGCILLIDDEPSVRRVLGRMLEQMGFDVLAAEDGARGVEMYRDHKEEVVAILLDMNMPTMNGEEAYRGLRTLSADVPVFISSGYQEEDIVGKFAGRGVAGFIQKPYRPREIVAALRPVLEPDAG